MSLNSKARRGWHQLVPDPNDDRRPIIRDRRVVYRSRVKTLYELTADYGEFTRDYVVSELGHRAGVVVVVDGRVLLVRQHRLLIDDLSWEIPGGAVADGEDPIDAAARECLEETGVECRNLRPLVGFHLSLDIFYNPTTIFYATEIATDPAGRRPDPHEIGSVDWVPLERCIDMVFSGEIADSFSIIGLLGYRALSPKP